MIARLRYDLQDPVTVMAGVILLQLIVWTLAPALVHSAPPLDVVEGLMWGREWAIITYKHPALPSWVLETARILSGGGVGWPEYLASQLFVAATFALVFLLGRDLMDAQRAAAGALLLTGVSTYAWGALEFNHNIAQLPFWAGVSLAVWRAVERQSVLWWVLIAVFAAGGMYAKFTTAVLLVVVLAWLVIDAKARRSLATPGPWVALAVFCLLTAPLAVSLYAHNFQPVTFAAARSMQGSGRIQGFILGNALTLIGPLVMLLIAGLAGPRQAASAADRSPAARPCAIEPRALRFLGIMLAGPPLLALLLALASGSGLRAAWGSPMFNLAGLFAIAVTSNRFRPQSLARIAVCAAALLVAVPIGYSVVIRGDLHAARKPFRVNWPQAEIARRFGDIWARETGGPLRIVAGYWEAGLVGVTAKDKPSIFTLGDFALSPWITPARLKAEGALALWEGPPSRMPPSLAPLVQGRPTRSESFKAAGGGRELLISYAVVPPSLSSD